MSDADKLRDCESALFEMSRRLCWIFPHAVNRGALTPEEARTSSVISDCIYLAANYRASYYTGNRATSNTSGASRDE